LSRINTWVQDLVTDDYGKFIYIRDNDSRKVWSCGWKPTCANPANYEVRHGVGYTTITNRINGIESELLQFVSMNEPLEIWKVTLRNKTNRKRNLSLFTYFELCMGDIATSIHKEYHKSFIGTRYDGKLGAIFGDKRGEAKREKESVWLKEESPAIFHSSSVRPKAYEGDKENFVGNYGSIANPKAVAENRLTNTTGRWSDPICSLQVELNIPAGGEKVVIFTLGSTEKKEEAVRLIKKYKKLDNVDKSFGLVRKKWNELLSNLEIETPDQAMNIMVNTWLKYQAISARLWARCAYYQTGGGFGFRDQLQDSQLYFYLKPELAKKQIVFNAEHQYKAGTVYHWWHMPSNWGMDVGFSDDLLWLPYVTLNYLDETKDYAFLNKKVKYIDAKAEPLYNHCLKAAHKALSRFSKRGLPLIGCGDWNDGMSSVGVDWKGESIWVGHFLYGILDRFDEICSRRGDSKNRAVFRKRKEALKKAINKYGWDGKWYIRAISDNGKVLGSSKSKEGKIYLNSQTWAIINKTTNGNRDEIAMKSAEKYLDREYGPLLLYPAYTELDSQIGYLTRYAAGIRENGGVYSHAATWAIMAECMLKRKKTAYNMYRKMIPPNRGTNPDLYRAEPYVMPGNIEGPGSANFGRGGWTWYTGSAAWMVRVITEWILGVRPGKDSLIVDPCIPKKWRGFKMKRLFRGKKYEIVVKQDTKGNIKTSIKRYNP
jgi:cellobiose phosphorylase